MGKMYETIQTATEKTIAIYLIGIVVVTVGLKQLEDVSARCPNRNNNNEKPTIDSNCTFQYDVRISTINIKHRVSSRLLPGQCLNEM